MPLIECPECGREVSSSAAACPECAYPVGTGTPGYIAPNSAWAAEARMVEDDYPIPGRTAVGFFLGVAGPEENSVAGYRDKIERLKAGRTGGGLDERIEDRMAEMEHRYREQMAQLEQMHTVQITELEERSDFTERLLTERRKQIGPG